MLRKVSIKTVLVILFSFQSVINYGQKTIGVELDAGLSRYTNFTPDPISEDLFLPSFNLGLFYNYEFKHQLFQAELLFSRLGDREKSRSEIYFAGDNSFESLTISDSKWIDYRLSLPLSYGFKIGRFSLLAGFQSGIEFYHKRIRKDSITKYTNPPYFEETVYVNHDIYLVFGVKAEFGFALNDKWALRCNYAYDNNRYQQLTLGLKYAFPTAQKDEKENTRASFIGLSLSPDLIYLSNEPENLISVPNYESGFGFTAGFRFMQRYNPQLSIETGILYAKKGFNVVEKPFPYKNTVFYRSSFLEIPLKANYTIQKKWGLYLTAGFSVGALFKTRTSSVSKNLQTGEKTAGNSSSGSINIDSYNLSLLSGFGVNRSLSKNLRLQIEPIWRRAITETYFNFQSSLGMNLSLFYQLNK